MVVWGVAKWVCMMDWLLPMTVCFVTIGGMMNWLMDWIVMDGFMVHWLMMNWLMMRCLMVDWISMVHWLVMESVMYIMNMVIVVNKLMNDSCVKIMEVMHCLMMG